MLFSVYSGSSRSFPPKNFVQYKIFQTFCQVFFSKKSIKKIIFPFKFVNFFAVPPGTAILCLYVLYANCIIKESNLWKSTKGVRRKQMDAKCTCIDGKQTGQRILGYMQKQGLSVNGLA